MALRAVEVAESDLGDKEPKLRTLLAGVIFIQTNHQIPKGPCLIKKETR